MPAGWRRLGCVCVPRSAGNAGQAGARGGASSPDLIMAHRQIEVSGFGEYHGLMAG